MFLRGFLSVFTFSPLILLFIELSFVFLHSYLAENVLVKASLQILLYKEGAQSDGIGNHWLRWSSGSHRSGGRHGEALLNLILVDPECWGVGKGQRDARPTEKQEDMKLGSRHTP